MQYHPGKNISNTEHQYFLIDTPEKIQELISTLSTQKEICFDTETTSVDANNCEFVGISFSIEPTIAYYIPVSANQTEAQKIIDLFKPILENENITKIGQNIKYDCLVLKWYNVEVKGVFFDTMLAHYLMEPDNKHGMDYLSETYLKYSTQQ